MGTLMETRIKEQEFIALQSSKIKDLLHELNVVNKQLEQQKLFNDSLVEQHRLEVDALVADRTKELEFANVKLRKQIVEGRKAEQQLYFDAHHDTLTQLPNRALLSDRLGYALRHLKRHPNQRFAVLFIDLDRFKMINDTLGHHIGDLFLVEIADRLRDCVRDNDVLARLGGDEFVISLDSLNADDVEEVASRIISSIEKPCVIENNTLYSNASIGIALSNSRYEKAEEILRDADTAMYQAKTLGRGRYVFFDERMRTKLIKTMSLEHELRHAIETKQLELHYQQIIDIDSRKTIGFEALLRWNHPTKGLLTPSDFIYLAEETSIILSIEEWVIEEVGRQLQRWHDDARYQHVFVAINLSGKHLIQVSQLSKLLGLIKKQTFDPQRLVLEFKETSLCNKHSELALKGLRKIKNHGVRLALDDYTSGLSSITLLHSYPFEFIKLDRSFIKTLHNSDKNLLLVKALHDLGEQFGFRLVAEGIESDHVLKKLHSVGCEFGQGYHINKPQKLQKTLLDNLEKNCA